jgi:hypothetical protein
MAQQIGESTRSILRKVSEGLGSTADLAVAFNQIPAMILVIRKEDKMRFVSGADQTIRIRTDDDMYRSDSNEPEPFGVTAKDGQHGPFVFTEGLVAHNFAKKHNLCDENGSFFSLEKPWIEGLHDFLMRGYSGIIVDPGTERELQMNRETVAELFAQLTMGQLVEIKKILVASSGESIHWRGSQNALEVIVFDNKHAAKHFVEQMEKEGNKDVGVKRMRTPDVIAFLIRTNVSELVVNAMLPDERIYPREDFVKMLRLLGADV